MDRKYQILKEFIQIVTKNHPYNYPDGSFSFEYNGRYICFYFEDFNEEGMIWHDLYIGAYLERDVCFEGINPIFETDLTLNYYSHEELIRELVKIISKITSVIDSFNTLVDIFSYNLLWKRICLIVDYNLTDNDADVMDIDNEIKRIPFKLIKS